MAIMPSVTKRLILEYNIHTRSFSIIYEICSDIDQISRQLLVPTNPTFTCSGHASVRHVQI